MSGRRSASTRRSVRSSIAISAPAATTQQEQQQQQQPPATPLPSTRVASPSSLVVEPTSPNLPAGDAAAAADSTPPASAARPSAAIRSGGGRKIIVSLSSPTRVTSLQPAASSGSIAPLTPEGTDSAASRSETPEEPDTAIMTLNKKTLPAAAQAAAASANGRRQGKKAMPVKQEPADIIEFDDLLMSSSADASGSTVGFEVLETKNPSSTSASGRPTRSTRTTKNLNFDAAYAAFDDAEDEDETLMEGGRKGKGKAAVKRRAADDSDSDDASSIPLASTAKRGRTITTATKKSRTSAAAAVSFSSDDDDDSDAYEPGVDDGVDPDDSDVVPDGGAFEHVSDFEGDDDELLDEEEEEEMKRGTGSKAKRGGKKPVDKLTAATAAKLAKAAADLYEDQDMEGGDSEDEDAMLQEAVLQSMRDQAGSSSIVVAAAAADDDAAIRRHKAERAALAAEKRARLQRELAKLPPAQRIKTEQIIDAAIVKKFGKNMQQGFGPVMSHDAKEKRLQEKKIAQEVRGKLKELERKEVKRIGRRLTQGEKNGLMLSIHHPELKDVWGDLQANIKVVKPVPMEAHPSLKLTLLPFQKESLYWMKKQEEGPWHGGMLADEMGMGKTIQTIALLLSEPRRKPSLVVAPVVALMQWKHEIETHAEGFTVCLWHGTGRMKAEKLKTFDVVLCSYGTLEAAFRKQQKGFKRGNVIVKEKSPMHTFQWHRVILDEAHNIKERSTNAAKATFALDAKYRWCLSGTPLQNRVGELYSLIRFLGGDPFAFYYCKVCPCKSLHWAFGNKRNCDDCGHSPMQHLCFWNNEILTPIQNYAMSGPGETAFKKLKILLDRMMLRRTKLERADDLGLPPRTITVRRDFFSPEEKELYLSLFSATQRQFSTYVSEGTVLNNYSNIFSLITRMRQMACHPDLVLRSKQAKYIPEAGQEEIVCRICNDVADDAIVSKCNHIFDRECIRQYLEMQNSPSPDCPVCHVGISIDLEGEAIDVDEDKRKKKQGILGRLDIDKWRSSTKLEALVEELTNLKKRDSTIKSLVFSQFVSFLDLIAFRLQRAGFTICRLEGGMSPQARDATIQHFMKNTHVSIMLISLKAGGVALNLTEASRVYLMDSWWNPSVERQAMDRIHRLGQHRSVEVIKLVVEDSIENRIVQLQDKKLAMTEAALSTDPDSALGKLTPEDLSFLFKL